MTGSDCKYFHKLLAHLLTSTSISSLFFFFFWTLIPQFNLPTPRESRSPQHSLDPLPLAPLALSREDEECFSLVCAMRLPSWVFQFWDSNSTKVTALILLSSSDVKQGHCKKKTWRCFERFTARQPSALVPYNKRGLCPVTLIGQGHIPWIFCLFVLREPPVRSLNTDLTHPRALTQTLAPHANTQRSTSVRLFPLLVFQVFVIQLIQMT